MADRSCWVPGVLFVVLCSDHIVGIEWNQKRDDNVDPTF
jgi:hypothetical protein